MGRLSKGKEKYTENFRLVKGGANRWAKRKAKVGDVTYLGPNKDLKRNGVVRAHYVFIILERIDTKATRGLFEGKQVADMFVAMRGDGVLNYIDAN